VIAVNGYANSDSRWHPAVADTTAIQRAMATAVTEHRIIANRNHGSGLPPSWRTLYALTKPPIDWRRTRSFQKWRMRMEADGCL